MYLWLQLHVALLYTIPSHTPILVYYNILGKFDIWEGGGGVMANA